MKPFVWKEGMTVEDTKNGAYWERNMLALMIAVMSNDTRDNDPHLISCGWYRHPADTQDPTHYLGHGTMEYWEDPKFSFYGWSRIISLFHGQVTFHVPDDFEMGTLQEIEPNWNGHTTEEKWNNVLNWCGINTYSESP